MKRQILFVQGGGKGAHDEWDGKLVESLRQALGNGYEIRYPRMPDEGDPSHASWGPAIERELEAMRDDAILVGHSVGGTILLKTLIGQSRKNFGAIFLLAVPFVGAGGWASDEIELPANLGARLPDGVPVHVWHGLQDETVPPPHVDLYARAIPQAHVHRLPNRDHQLNNDLTDIAAAILSLETRRRGVATKAGVPGSGAGANRAPQPR